MEKVLIKSCVKTDRQTKEGKAIYTVQADDKQCTSFGDDFSSDIMTEVEVEIKEGKEYQGVKQWYISKPKAKGFQKFPAKDWTLDKRKHALQCAVEFAKGKDVKSADVLKVADLFFDYLNQ